jgi:glutathione synthase/RimK-type ligase-like ATP-grasp enzyme
VLVAESARRHICRVSRAVERSYRVPAANAEPQAYVEVLESIVASERVDVLIPTCEEIFFIAKGLDRLRGRCSVWASPFELLDELHNKWKFVSLAKRLGLAVPPSGLIRTREEWLALAAAERLGESLVLKPAYSRFASRVIFLDNTDSPYERRRLLEETASAVTPATPWVAQRRIYGNDICTYSVVYEGDLIAHAAYPCRYRVGRGATVYYEPVENEAARDWVRQLVEATRFTGQIAFDFIEEEDGGLVALECNPRATSGVHLFDAELVQAFLQPGALRQSGVMLTPEPSRKAMLGAAMLAAGVSGIRSFRELREWRDAFRSARDVVFSRSDLRPSAEQLRVLFDAWRKSRTHGITLAQATTIDIEWNGDA